MASGEDAKIMGCDRRALGRRAGWAVLGLCTATLLIGFAHTPWGRPLLARLRGAPGCPVLQDLDPEKVERTRIDFAKKRAGMARAPARPALGFELGKSRKAKVSAALEQRGAECTNARKDTALECKAGAEDLFLQFDGAGRLVAVDVFRTPPSSGEAIARLNAIETNLEQVIGPPTARRGSARAEYLQAQPFRQVSLEYRYSDYVGRVSATNFGASGLRVREQYQWIPG